MTNMTVRNLPDETYQALKLSAVAHGRSLEAEIRDILVKTMQNQERELLHQLKLGCGAADEEQDENLPGV
jgi:plasmid stability protein